MAGDWIKVEKATARKPEVLRIADILQVHPDHAFGLCVRFWFWCDDQMVSGHAPSVTIVTLDTVFGHAGFVSALLEVGWLRVREGSLEVPNFERHLSESAKNRALSGRRKQKQRSKPVTEMSRAKRDEGVTREKKSNNSSTETTSPPKSRAGPFDPHAVPIPKELDLPGFREAWTEWIAYRASVGKALTEQSIQGQFRQMIPHGVSAAVDAINRSIASGWQGLFPEKEVNRGQRGGGGSRADRIGPGQSFRPDQEPAGGAVTDF